MKNRCASSETALELYQYDQAISNHFQFDNRLATSALSAAHGFVNSRHHHVAASPQRRKTSLKNCRSSLVQIG